MWADIATLFLSTVTCLASSVGLYILLGGKRPWFLSLNELRGSIREFPNPEEFVQPPEYDENVVVPVKVRRVPFAKPSGKRQPKINDDKAAWAKENDA